MVFVNRVQSKGSVNWPSVSWLTVKASNATDLLLAIKAKYGFVV